MQALPPDAPPRAAGKSIFEDTIAEMTYPQVEAAIVRGAVGLWAIGVIEQHGPHLPTGTDDEGSGGQHVVHPDQRILGASGDARLRGAILGKGLCQTRRVE